MKTESKVIHYINYANEFVKFLKDCEIYDEYMTVFKKDSKLKPTDRYLINKPIRFKSFLRNIGPIYWIVQAFIWTYGTNTIDWNTYHKLWNETYYKLKANETTNTVTSVILD